MKYRRALIGLPLLVAATVVHAETLYVIETLVVNVNSAPDATGERVANIKSGEAVEVIERQDDQVHVRLANGTEGWVKKSYLSADESLTRRLADRTAEVDKLKQDVTRLQAEVASAKAAGASRGPTPSASTHAAQTQQVSAASSQPAAQPPASTAAANQLSAASNTSTPDPAGAGASETNTPADPNAHEPPYFMTPPDAPAHPVWHWALGSFLAALCLGFVLGWNALDRRIRRKYGGLRIY